MSDPGLDTVDDAEEPFARAAHPSAYDQEYWRPEENGHKVILGGEVIPSGTWVLPGERKVVTGDDQPSNTTVDAKDVTQAISRSLAALARYEVVNAIELDDSSIDAQYPEHIEPEDPADFPVERILRAVESAPELTSVVREAVGVGAVKFERALYLAIAHGLVVLEHSHSRSEPRIRLTSTGREILPKA